MRRIVLMGIILMCSHSALANKPNGIWAWQDDTVAEQVKVLEQGLDHPCGMTHKIVLNKMPSADKASQTGLEVVVEYRKKKVINRWVVPVDTVPLAIDDENLVVSHNPGPLLVNIQGFITLLYKQTDMSIPLESCPGFLDGVFREPDNLICLKIPDKKTKQPRYLAYKGPCN